MSSRAAPRITRNIVRGSRIVSNSVFQLQRQRTAVNAFRGNNMRSCYEFMDASMCRAMSKMNRVTGLTRVEMQRIQVILVSSLLSKSVTVSQLIEDALKSAISTEEEEEGSGSRVLLYDDV